MQSTTSTTRRVWRMLGDLHDIVVHGTICRALKYISEHFELSKEDCAKIGIGSQEDETKIRVEYDSDNLILFSDANWWTALSHAVLERNPDIEVTSLRSKHGKPCKVLHVPRT